MNKDEFLKTLFDEKDATVFNIKGINIKALKALPINENDLLNNGTGFIYDFDTDRLSDIALMLRVAVELFKKTTEKAETLRILVDKNEIKALFKNNSDDDMNDLIKEVGFIHDKDDNRIIAGGTFSKHYLFTFTQTAEKAIKQ